MDCEECGAVVPEGATTCPECGVPVSDSPTTVSTGPTEPTAKSAGGMNKWLIVGIAVVLVVLIGAGAWYFMSSGAIGGGDPKTAATKMMTAYAAYDAKGILEVSTHASLDATGTKSFEDAATQAKTRAAGKAGVKDFKVDSVDQSGDQTATVTITGQWLTDPAKGTYTKRTEKLGLVKQSGKWLVQLF
jgi:hypothetical protein